MRESNQAHIRLGSAFKKARAFPSTPFIPLTKIVHEILSFITMTRWHAPACQAPDIIVNKATSIPSCRNCGLTPNLGDIIAQQGTSNPFPEPPPDELPGQINLWWPPTVKYKTYDPDLDDMITSPSPSASSVMSSLLPQEPYTDPVCRTPVYPHPISPSQFRLAVLTPRASASSPVHLELETYSLLNHPEYETASYTWGGEDNNNERSQPIYIGDYWDVLLQTQNCWDLLRFLQPRRGVRLVWVDAICINQLDVGERASQVAQMGRIYQQAFQTVVYLGPDLAPDLGEARWPSRERLRDLGEIMIADRRAGSNQEMKSVLERRYFSRLWIVQELILSSRVAIRVGNVEYRTGGGYLVDMTSPPPPSCDKPRRTLLWDRYLASGSESGIGLAELLRITATMSCADRRDHLFALLGMVGKASQRPEPNYSLSCRHVFAGLMADIIITQQFYHVLAYGSGISSGSQSSVPSWIPDWRIWDSWAPVFQHMDSDNTRQPIEVLFYYLNGEVDKIIRQRWESTSGADLLTFLLPEYWSFPYDDPKYPPTELPWSDSKGWKLDLDPKSNLTFRGFAIPVDRPGCYQELFDMSVESTTGALVANMFRIVTLDSIPVPIGAFNVPECYFGNSLTGYNVFEVSIGQRKIYLCSQHPLDHLVKPGVDSLYLFVHKAQSRFSAAYILRKSSAAFQLPQYHHLVGYCFLVFMSFPLRQEPRSYFQRFQVVAGNPSSPIPEEGVSNCAQCCESGQPQLLAHDGIWHGDVSGRIPVSELEANLSWTLTQVIQRAHNWFEAGLEPFERLFFMDFQANSKHKDFTAVYQALLNTNWPPVGFLEIYQLYLDPRLQPKLHHGDNYNEDNYWGSRKYDHGLYMVFTLAYDEFTVLSEDSFYRRCGGSEDCTYEYRGLECDCRPKRPEKWAVQAYGQSRSESISSCGKSICNRPGPRFTPPETVEVRLCIQDMMQRLSGGSGVRVLYMLKEAARITGGSELDLTSRKPTAADDLVRVPTGPTAQRLMEECGLEGILERVAIL